MRLNNNEMKSSAISIYLYNFVFFVFFVVQFFFVVQVTSAHDGEVHGSEQKAMTANARRAERTFNTNNGQLQFSLIQLPADPHNGEEVEFEVRIVRLTNQIPANTTPVERANITGQIKTVRGENLASIPAHAEDQPGLYGVHYSEIDVDLKESARSRAVVLNDIREKLSVIPGVVINVGQPISHRIDHLLSGIRAQTAIKVFGDDLDTLRAKAEEIRNVVSTVSGATDVQIEKQVLIPQVRFIVNRSEAARYGLTPGEVAETLETALNGKAVSEAVEGQRRFDVVVRFDDQSRNSLEALRRATVDTPANVQVPVSAVADIVNQPGPNQILRENNQRRIVVMANTAGRDLGSVVKEIQERIGAQVTMPQGYFLEYGGQFEAQQNATKRLTLLSIFSVLAIFFLLMKGLGARRCR